MLEQVRLVGLPSVAIGEDGEIRGEDGFKRTVRPTYSIVVMVMMLFMMMMMMVKRMVGPTVFEYNVRPVPPSFSMHLKLPLSLLVFLLSTSPLPTSLYLS